MTIVIDTSAITAILRGEPEAVALAKAIRAATNRLLSAATLVETNIVAIMQRRSADEVESFVRAGKIDVVPLTGAHARIATEGFRRFGKGRHPARLNFGDCFSYALARSAEHPLLFIGEDFSKTDVIVAPF